MKSAIKTLLLLGSIWAAVALTVNASSMYFYFTQGTGDQEADYIGDLSSDNPDWLTGANNVTSPAYTIVMTFYNPSADIAYYQCWAHTNVSAGTYPVGDFVNIYGIGAYCYAVIQ